MKLNERGKTSVGCLYFKLQCNIVTLSYQKFDRPQTVILFGHFTTLYASQSQSKNGFYFPNFMYFSTYFHNFYDIFSQM